MAGARKRKAGKKKGKNGDALNPNNQQHSSNSSNHSQGSDDPKFVDDRESDGGEVEREEIEKREIEGEGVVDNEEGGCEDGKELVEEVVEITKDAIAGVFGKLRQELNGSADVDSSAVDVADETPVQVLISEDDVPVNGGVQDDEVAIEKEKSIVADLEEVNGEVVPPVSVSVFGHEVPKPVLELMQDGVSLSLKMSADSGSLVKLGAVHPEVIQDVDGNSLISDEKDKISSAMDDLPSEKIETKVSSVDGDESLDGLPAEVSGLENSGKNLEVSAHLEEQAVAPAATVTQVWENLKNGEVFGHLDDKVGSVEVVGAEKEAIVDCVKNGEPLKVPSATMTQVWENLKNGEVVGRLDDEVGSVEEVGTEKQASVDCVKNGEPLKVPGENVNTKVVTSSGEVDSFKEIETQKRSAEQPSTGSNPLPIRKASLFGCCGLSELFSSAYR